MAKSRRIDTFGGRLRVAREDAGLKQEELTALLEERYGVHVGRSYISELERNWESNKMPMSDVLAALAVALEELAAADLSAIPDEGDARAAEYAARLAEHDAALARHQQALRRADTAFVSGVMDEERYREQVKRLRAAIETEQSARTQLQAAADAEQQAGSRADRLAEIRAAGPAMLTIPAPAAANAWFRRYVRVYVRGNQVVEVRFL